MGTYEKRFLNFFIRASFHDSLAVNATACAQLDPNTVRAEDGRG